MSNTESDTQALGGTLDADTSDSEAELHRTLQQIISLLVPLSAQSRARLIGTVMAYFGDISPRTSAPKIQGSSPSSAFSVDRSLSPKEFLFEKLPQSDVERVVCLAYYLTHYQDTPYFKTLDISKLNTEAAQRKFANATYTVRNAFQLHYLTSAPSKGKRQISAAGEVFVHELPDRAAAKAAMAAIRPRRKSAGRKKTSKKKKKTSE